MKQNGSEKFPIKLNKQAKPCNIINTYVHQRSSSIQNAYQYRVLNILVTLRKKKKKKNHSLRLTPGLNPLITA